MVFSLQELGLKGVFMMFYETPGKETGSLEYKENKVKISNKNNPQQGRKQDLHQERMN